MTIGGTRPDNHSRLVKVLLDGYTLPATTTHNTITATAELNLALDNIFFHPNVGPFISRRLIQRLVTSNPSPGYLYRVTQVFNDDGTGVRGNMKAVIKAILTDYEARTTDLLGNDGYGKLREPLLRATAVIRAFHPESPTTEPNGTGLRKWALSSTDANLAQTAYRSPTVFNFFEPDYMANGDVATASLFTPEMQIMTEGTAISSANFLYSGIYTTTGWPGGDVRLNLTVPAGTSERDLAANPTNLVNHLNLLLMGGQMPSDMSARIVLYLGTLPNTNNTDRLARARAAVHLVASSTQFSTQK
jgi:Protein of unknown function (DUF1800)